MNFIKTTSLKKNMLITIALISAFIVLFTIILGASQASKTLKEDAQKALMASANKFAIQVEADLEVGMDSARTIAHAFSGLKKQNITDRKVYEAILKESLSKNELFFATWTIWEPNALDSKDSEFINQLPSDKSGRFIPYYYKADYKSVNLSYGAERQESDKKETSVKSNKILVEPLKDYDQMGKNDFYHLPKQLKQEVLVNPYWYEAGNQKLFMTSVAVPIIIDDKVVGVVGVDIVVDYLQHRFDTVKPYNHGYSYITTPNMKFVYHPKHDLIDQSLENLFKTNIVNSDEAKFIAEMTTKQKEGYLETSEKLRVHTPIPCGASPLQWSLSLVAKVDDVTADIKAMMINSILLGLASVGVLIFLISRIMNRSIFKPLQEMTKSMNTIMESGDFQYQIKIIQQDEFGQVMHILNQFNHEIYKSLDEINQVMKGVATGNYNQQLLNTGDSIGNKGDFANMKNCMNQALNSLNNMTQELNKITNAIVHGNFKERVSNSVGGDFKRNVDQAMESLETILLDINQVMSAICIGDLSKRVNANAEGDLNVLKNNINHMLQTLFIMMNQLNQAIQALSKGDLTQQIHIDQTTQGQFKTILNLTNQSFENLKLLISDVNRLAQNIYSAIQDISLQNNSLSDRTNEQAAAVEQTLASLNNVIYVINANTQKSKNVNDSVQESVEVAERGGEIVAEVITTMQDISNSSKRINDIIGIIDAIAFQTNILALNAAVEAARAGEQGKGFAVVASEVRNLAQRSSSASRDIRNLIIESVQKVENGSNLVQNAGNTMEEIVDAIKSITHLMQEISDGSIEQANGIGQVQVAMSSMDGITQQNSVQVEEVSTTSVQVSQQVSHLLDSVNKFKI